MNKAILIGNLGKDPELRSTNSGMEVCNFTVATSGREKKPDGTWGESTEWHNVVCFGKQAELVAKFLRKGKKVGIEGRIVTRSYEKDGVKKWSTEIIANEVEFLSPRDDAGSGGGSRSGGGGYGGNHGSAPDDDVPFS